MNEVKDSASRIHNHECMGIQRKQVCQERRLSYFPVDGRALNDFPTAFSHELITDSFAKLKEMQVMVSACNNR